MVYSKKNGRTVARLSATASWELFDSIANAMEIRFGGRWINKLDGFDQRYWDLEIDEVVLTLHLEHYLGISLFPAPNPDQLIAANSLVETIGGFLNAAFDEDTSATLHEPSSNG